MNKLKKQLLILYLALSSTLVGCGSVRSIKQESSEETSILAEIPEAYYDDDLDSTTTISDLNNLYSLDISPKDTSSLDFIDNCINIHSLCIDNSNCTYEDWDCLSNQLNKIDFKKFNNLENVWLTLYSYGSPITFDEDNFKFLEDIPNLKQLNIISNWIDKDFLESFENIEELSVFSTCNNLNIDYKKLKNLKKIDFSFLEPYSLAINLTKEDLDYFKNNGIEVVFDDDSYFSKIIDINNKLNIMLDEIGIQDTDSDKEKLRKISLYIVDNLEYDRDISKKLEQNEDTGSDDFYKDGFLYGALEKKSQICGNYSALLHALGNRVGLEIYDVGSNEHAWNMIRIDEEYYIVDLTFVDYYQELKDILRNGNISDMDYYLKDIDEELKENSDYFTLDVKEEVIKESDTYVKKLNAYNYFKNNK